jgi:hypothetical protein
MFATMPCSLAAVGPGVALVLTLAVPARADHCEPVVLAPRAGVQWTAAVRGEAARFRNQQAQGSWLGLRGELGAGLGGFHLRGWVPIYRLERDGDRRQGLGDVGLAGQWQAWGQPGGPWALGPSLAVTLPTGAAGEGLGMGHPMVMPGAWWALGGRSVRASGVMAYGRALSSAAATGHQHHHGSTTGSLVDPMNRVELMASAALAWTFVDSLRAELAALGALPLTASDGTRRLRGGLALAYLTGPFELGAGLELPLVGDFFRGRSLLTVTARN